MASIATIKAWFTKGLKPTQAQFWSVFDSFRHKDDTIAINDVTGLTEVLTNTVSASSFNSYVNGQKYTPAIDITLFNDLKDGSGVVPTHLAIDRLARIVQDGGYTPPEGSEGFPFTFPYPLS